MNTAAIKAGINGVMIWGKAHAPQILIGTGILSGVGATVAGCIATSKTDGILIEHKTSIDILKTKLERNEISDEECKKEINKQYGRTILRLAGTWGPCVGLTAVSATSTLAGFGIVKKDLVVKTSALTAISKKFDNYRNEVIIDQGVEKDRFYISGGASKKALEKGKAIPDNALTPTVSDYKRDDAKAAIGDPSKDPYCVFHYLYCEESVDWRHYSDVPGSNLASILAQQQLMQFTFETDGFLDLDTVYKALGLDRRILWSEAAEGRHYGWVSKGYTSDGLADDTVDFGIFDQDVQHKLFRSGEINEVMLNFNCRLIDEETYKKLARG